MDLTTCLWSCDLTTPECLRMLHLLPYDLYWDEIVLVCRLFRFMKMACCTDRTVYRHQAKFVWKAIQQRWMQEEARMAEQHGGEDTYLGGDGRWVLNHNYVRCTMKLACYLKSVIKLCHIKSLFRCDSMGHSAHYLSYGFFDLVKRKILHIQLVTVSSLSCTHIRYF